LIESGWRYVSFVYTGLGILLCLVMWLFLRDNGRPMEEASHPTSMLAPFISTLKIPLLWGVFIVGAMSYLPLVAYAELWGIPFLKSSYNISKQAASLHNSMVFIGWGLGAPFFGFVYDHFPSWRRLTLITMLASSAAIALVIMGYVPIALLPITLFAFGFFGSAHVLVFAASRTLCDKANEGLGMALTNLFIMMSGVLYPPLIGYFMDTIARWHWLPIVFDKLSFSVALSIIPFSMLVSIVIIYILPCPSNEEASIESACN